MPHTLRRKMFKLGGEVNSHGVGLTSGLNYNRPGYDDGGKVDPRPRGYMRGPDGKMREAHNPLLAGLVGSRFLPFIMPGIRSTIGAGRALFNQGLPGLSRFIRTGTTATDDLTRFGIRDSSALTNAMARERAAASLEARRKALNAMTKKKSPAYKKAKESLERAQKQFDDEFGSYFGRRTTSGAIGRGLGSAAGAGTAISLPAAFIPEYEGDSALGQTLELARKGAQGLSAVGPLAEINFLGQLAASPFTGQSFDDMALTPAGTIQNLLQGPDSVTAEGSKGPVADVVETQEEQFAGLVQDAEERARLYQELMGEEPDRIGALSKGLMRAGAIYDEDKGMAVAALGEEADAETQRVKDVERQIKGMAVQDVIGAETNKQQLVDQAKLAIVSSPDLTPDARSQALKGIEAYEQGVIDTLPLNAKQDGADLDKMSTGSVYFDPYNIYGGMYVAVSSNNQDPEQVKGFNDITEAQAHAKG